MRRAVGKCNEYKTEIVRLRAQVEEQRRWLDSPDVADDALWDQRQEIHHVRWQMLEQDIGNLTGWVSIHLAEAGRYNGLERKAAQQWVRELYRIEEWIREEDLVNCVQYPNGDPIPF
jgi:hypothetical protein